MTGKMDPETRPIEDLFDRLRLISNETLDDFTDEKKKAFEMHPMRRSLFGVLCDLKESTKITPPDSKDSEETEIQLARLNNMLSAEGVTAPVVHKEDQADYQKEVCGIRVEYTQNIENYEKKRSDFSESLTQLLRVQAQMRPIAGKDIQRMIDIVHQKFNIVQIQIKQGICEKIMTLKHRFLDARRKRRNFTKQATDILNDFFFANLNNPYPSEEVKEQLARQCNITVGQVTNWFGNKRIRYKKNIGKNAEEAMMHAAKRAAMENVGGQNPLSVPLPIMPPGGYGMLPPPIFNPYAGVPDMGMNRPPFDFSLYNPQMMLPPSDAKPLQ